MVNQPINTELAFDLDDASTEVKIPSKDTPILKTPDAANPLICKILPNPLRNKDIYYEVDYIKHMIGPDPQKDTRYHLSLKMLGGKAPEVEKYWEAHGQLKALKAAGKENTDEYRKWDTIKKMFNVNKRYWLLVLRPGDTKPKALKVTYKCIARLFGAEANYKDPAIVGLVDQMRTKHRDPLSLKAEYGWIKMYRTGTGLTTDWVVEEYMTEQTLDGGIQALIPVKTKIALDTSKLTKADIVDVSKLDLTSDQVWTEAECQTFVDSVGTVIPDRCKRQNQGGIQATTVEQQPAASAKPATIEAPAGDFDLDEYLKSGTV